MPNEVENYLSAIAKFHVDEMLNILRNKGVLAKKKSNDDGNGGVKDEKPLITSNKTEPKVDEQTSAAETLGEAVQHIYDLRDIVRVMYADLNNISSPDINSLKPYDITSSLAKDANVEIPNLASTTVRDAFDSQTLLRDKEVQADIVGKLDFQRTYLPILNGLLEYFTKQKIKNEFATFNIAKPDKQTSSVDLIATDFKKIESDMLIEVMYREKAINVLKDDLSNVIEKLNRYDRSNNRDSILLIVLFSNEGTDSQEKLSFRFKQYMEELFPTYLSRIFLANLYVKNAHQLKDELKKVRSRMEEAESAISDFILNTQPANTSPGADDHVYSKTLDLTKYTYEISFKPQVEVMPYWRFGLVFAKKEPFKFNERHAIGQPVYHLTKNPPTNSETLLETVYSPTREVTYEGTTLIQKYNGGLLTMLVSSENNETTIDVVDQTRSSILMRPARIGQYPLFRVFAWADAKNFFAFNVRVKEKTIKFPKATAIQSPKRSASHFMVKVVDVDGVFIVNAETVILQENDLFHEGTTNEYGEVQFKLSDEITTVTILVAHPEYLSAVIDKVSIKEDALVTLKQASGAGSVVFAKGTGHIPGLDGRLNPILDTHNRKYFYADNIVVDGSYKSPANFELNEPMVLTDSHGVVKKIFFRLIRGRTSILDYIS